MKGSIVLRFAIAPVFVLLIVSGAMGKSVQVGTCIPHLQTYSTISQAVSSVAPGSTVLVCPGTYPEQITINQPLILRGIKSGNAANPVITVPAGGLTQNVVAPTNGVVMTFQILVQGTEAGQVAISNIAVDGSSGSNASVSGWISGIYYQNSSGAITNVATYGQKGNGYGFGIFLEGTTAPAKLVSVKHCSVHDFDSEGIRSNGSVAPPSLAVDIRSNAVVSSTSFGSAPEYGEIDVQGAAGSIVGNRVVTYPAPPGISTGSGIVVESNSVVSGNTVINTGIIELGDSNVISANTVLWGGGITVVGNGNTVQNNSSYGAGISFNCTGTSNTVTNNTINDSDFGIMDHSGNTIAPNWFLNVARMVLPPC